MTKSLRNLIDDLHMNHEYCPKEIILQAANELENAVALVLAEREACAALAEEVGRHKNHIGIAASIRARGDV